MRSASSIILKLTLNYKTFEYLEWHSRVQHRWKLIILGKFHSQVIEQFVSNFHESHRSKYRFSDWTEAKRSGRINERRVQNKRQHLGLIAVPKKKKRKLSENSAAKLTSCHWYLSISRSPPHANRLNRVYDNRDRELHRLADGSNMRVWIGFPRNPSRWKLNLRGIERTNHFERSCKSTVIFVISYIASAILFAGDHWGSESRNWRFIAEELMSVESIEGSVLFFLFRKGGRLSSYWDSFFSSRFFS